MCPRTETGRRSLGVQTEAKRRIANARPKRHRRANPLGHEAAISYRWDLALDRLTWGHGAARFFGLRAITALRTGEDFASHLIASPGASRAHVILFSNETDQGFGVPYRAVYGFTRPDSSTLWVEDTGRWFAGRDGRPAYARGLLREVAEPIAVTHEACEADFLTQLDRDFAWLRRHGGEAALFAFAPSDESCEIEPDTLTQLRSFARIGDRVGIAGRLLLLFARTCPHDQAEHAAQRIAHHLSQATGQRLMSCALPIPNATAHSITAIQMAERALYGTAPSAHDPLTRALNALNARTVGMVCQPIVAAGSRQLVFCEALARIPDGQAGFESTQELVLALETHGSIPLLDHRILSLALDALEDDPKLIVSVNVAPRSLANADWFRYAEVRLARRPELAARLIFEITEQAEIALLAHTKKRIAQIKEWGVKLALDDFGMGRTSLRHLSVLPVDFLKIAGPFVQNCSRSMEDRQFVGALIDMARQLGIKTVAEWVEDEATAKFLEERGIDFMQGQYFSQGTRLFAPQAQAQAPRRVSARRSAAV